MITFTYSTRFKKHFQKLSVFEKKQFKQKISLFSLDPFHPSLRTKKIQGTDSLFEFSVNMDIRVIWFYENNCIVALIDIGHHDILNNF